jgi:hypothetical protein
MSLSSSACACLGPVGDCPCVRRAKGLPVPIPQTRIYDDLWDCLSDEDKTTVNGILQKALGLWLTKKNQSVDAGKSNHA